MRVLMLTDRFPPEARASGHLFHELGASLVKRGHELAVVTRMPRDYVPDGTARGAAPSEWLDGMRVLRVRGLSALRQAPFMRAVDHLTVAFSFALAARRWPAADVVLIYSPPLPLAVAAALYQRWTGAPWVLNLHDFYPRTAVELGLLRNPLAIKAARSLERFAYRHAARIVVPAPRSREILVTGEGMPPDRVAIVTNWADVEAVRPGSRENAFRHAHALSGKYVVSYAGVMGFAQNLTPLIAAAWKLHERDDIVFLLVGDGVNSRRWRREAEGLRNVRFLPMLAKEKYFDLLRASDICVVPLAQSLNTPAIPGKIQNIMAVGRPVLAIMNPYSDAAALVTKGQCGVVVPPDRPEEVAERILQLHDDPALAEALGVNGRAYAEQNCSRQHAVATWEAILVGVASGRGSRPSF